MMFQQCSQVVPQGSHVIPMVIAKTVIIHSPKDVNIVELEQAHDCPFCVWYALHNNLFMFPLFYGF
jgi:hypothetical protein